MRVFAVQNRSRPIVSPYTNWCNLGPVTQKVSEVSYAQFESEGR